MQLLEFKVGDTAWCHLGGADNSLVEGKVVHIFTLPDTPFPLYVLEMETSMDPMWYVREGHTLSDDPFKPIGMWRRPSHKSTDVAGEKLHRIPKYADVMTRAEFEQSVEDGNFTDYDGHGYLSTPVMESEYWFQPSTYDKNFHLELGCVTWYNR